MFFFLKANCHTIPSSAHPVVASDQQLLVHLFSFKHVQGVATVQLSNEDLNNVDSNLPTLSIY